MRYSALFARIRAHRLLVVVLVVIGVMVVAATVASRHTQTASQYAQFNGVNVQQLDSYWRGQIQQLGSGPAYSAFADSISGLSAPEQHFRAHIFGQALYEQVGLPGVVVCDGQFSGGCFHQFMAQAITENGSSIVGSLASSCISSKSIFCAHGIGHGLVALDGYERTDLDTELQGCGSFPNTYRDACYNGVFMEYEERTTLSQDGVDMPFTGDWYEPCDSLEGRQQFMCIFHQPKWWWDILTQRGDGNEAAAKKIGELCMGAGTQELLTACIRSVGDAFGLKVDGKIAASLCPYAFSDSKQVFLCSEGLAQSIIESGGSLSEACGYISDTQRSACETYVQQFSNEKGVSLSPL